MFLFVIFVGKLVLEVGIFLGVLNIVFGYGFIVGVFIVEYMDIDKVVFMGLMEVGKFVMVVVVCSNLKFVILEFGGKLFMIICEDVNVDEVVEFVYFVLFFNMG